MLFKEINIHQIYNFVCDKTINFKVFSNKNNILTFNELTTVCITSFMFFKGNYTNCLSYMIDYKLIPRISLSAFSKARNRDFEKIDELILITLSHFNKNNLDEHFMIDSFPVEACCASRNSSLFKHPHFTGYCAAKNLYYKGFKVMVITDNQGFIKEFDIVPAHEHDITITKKMDLKEKLPSNSKLYADKGFSCKELVNKMLGYGINLLACKKKNEKDLDEMLQKEIVYKRKPIESFINNIVSLSGHNMFKFNNIEGLIQKIKLMILSYNVGNILC